MHTFLCLPKLRWRVNTHLDSQLIRPMKATLSGQRNSKGPGIPHVCRVLESARSNPDRWDVRSVIGNSATRNLVQP